MKKVLIILPIVLFIVSCGKENPKPKPAVDPHFQSENIEQIKVYYWSDVVATITNRNFIDRFNQLIQESLKSTRKDPFPDSTQEPVFFVYHPGDKDLDYVLDMNEFIDDKPVYFTARSIYTDVPSLYFSVESKDELITLLRGAGLPVEKYEQPKHGWRVKPYREWETHGNIKGGLEYVE